MRRILTETILAAYEALRRQDRLSKSIRGYRTYYYGASSPTDSLIAAHALQACITWPWPSDQAILIAPYVSGDNGANWIAHDHGHTLCGGASIPRKKTSHLYGDLIRSTGRLDPAQLMAVSAKVLADVPHAASDVASIAAVSPRWALRTRRGGKYFDAIAGASMCYAFAHLAVPCHYLCRVVPGTIGSGDVRRHYRAGGEIMAWLRFDRLYRQVLSDGHTDTCAEPTEPHYRRGHLRHLWGKSGINRHTLPKDAADRIALAINRRVTRVYVSPAWIGPDEIMLDGMRVKILAGDLKLSKKVAGNVRRSDKC